jgi:hypothetical protein
MRFTRPVLMVAVTGALVFGGAGAAVAQAQTVALWKMDDSGSTMTDSSGHGHTGTLHNVQVGGVGYDGGRAFGFAGKPSYVSVPSATDLNPGISTFSVALHVRFGARPSSTVGDYDVLRKGLSTSDGGSYKIEILGDGHAFCDFRGSLAEGSVRSGGALAVNVWHAVTCVRTATSVALTVDGATTTRIVATGSISNTGNLMIGAKNSAGGDQLSGLEDQVTLRKG